MALTREQVVSTAVELLRRYGLGDLSMRRLARELGVAPGALYWHVENKQQLLVEVAAALLDAIALPAVDVPPEEALTGLALAVREALVAVPDGADVVAVAQALDPGSLRPLRELARLVERCGAGRRERDAATALVLHHVLGSVAAQQNRALAVRQDPDVALPDADESVKAFEVGLAVVVAGLRAQ